MAKRSYSTSVIKQLFGSCGNQCAAPECTNPIIARETEYSDAAVIGQICHIYAAADNGPRGKPGLKPAERNALNNLILMCGHHHPLVDKQYETYPANLLKQWKKEHEAKYQPETAEAIKLQESMQQMAFVQTFSDQQIEVEVERIRKNRFLNSYQTRGKAIELAGRIDNSELVGGSRAVRAKGLAWCARWLAHAETLPRARELLEKSTGLAASEEAVIAEAFITSVDNPEKALGLLAPLNSVAARSAALRIVTNKEQAEGAVAWTQKAGLSAASFDAEGKLLHLLNQLAAGQWAEALESAAAVAGDDITNTPVLSQALAMVSLVQVVPVELRHYVMSQVPFDAAQFPLADDESSLTLRRCAAADFERASDFAVSAGVAPASNPASDFALWLKLRDQKSREQALDALRESMRDPSQSLRRLALALQFGLKLDLAAIEKEIDQRVALSGQGTADEAFARFALAFARNEPGAVADYIGRHRVLLYAHLHKNSIQMVEIEMLARAGQAAAAKERFAEAVADGLGEREQQHLRRVIEEAEGADPAAARKKLFEETGRLQDLANLVNFLEQQQSWQELLPFANQMFAATHALEDALRVARVLNATEQYGGLLEFLEAHPGYIAQSSLLKTMLAWSLYRHGRFGEASNLLKELAATRDDPNDRALRVSLAIASGNWDDLAEHATSEWNRRDQRTAAELLAAAEIARAVGNAHATELIEAAAEKAGDDPNILAGAYFHALQGGWEGKPVVAGWLHRAIELSGDDGPLQSVSMKEIYDRKPEWDRQAASVWEQLNEGKIPIFGAAHLLHRSLIDLVLLQALGNLAESDARRRSVVYSYSGARQLTVVDGLKTVALDLTAIFTLAQLGLLPQAIGSYERVLIPHATLGWLFEERQRASFHQPSRIKEAHELKRLVADGALKVWRPRRAPDLALVKEVGVGLAGLLTVAQSATETDGIPRFVVRSAPVHRIGSLMEEEADLSGQQGRLCSCQTVVRKLRRRGVLTLEEEQRALAHLQLQERQWAVEPDIQDNAELYLDDLSTTYLQTVGVLGKLKPAGLTTYITDDDDADANRLISYESLSERQLELIESVRHTLAEGLKSGRVTAVKSRALDDEKILQTHPTFGVLGIEETVDAFVVDDRFVNRHQHMEASGYRTPILSALDLLDDLVEKGVISEPSLFAHRTQLRQAGFQLVPVTDKELDYHLAHADFDGAAITETAELRAIRESLLKARMSKMLQIPAEVPWLHRTMAAIIRSIKTVWKEKASAVEAAAYADWLVALTDVRGWAPSAVPGGERNFALYAHAAHLQSLMSPPAGVPDEVRDAFYAWIDERVMQDIRDHEPEIFQWLVKQAEAIIVHMADTAVKELGS